MIVDAPIGKCYATVHININQCLQADLRTLPLGWHRRRGYINLLAIEKLT